MSSIPTPCDRVLIDGQEVAIFRCEADGGVVFEHQALLRLHPGHRFLAPTILKDGELEQIGAMWEEVHSTKEETPSASSN